MKEPKFEDVLNEAKSTSRTIFMGRLVFAISEALENEHYNLAAQLRDEYKRLFNQDLPDMDMIRKILEQKKGL